ncbi:hypothetical protein [Paeniglutamicibacter sp.]|uniref:hypothetical protein n=1 Tax=Paeniglutamicibacter sp. TaxID=1934391 RepID=UPI003989E600
MFFNFFHLDVAWLAEQRTEDPAVGTAMLQRDDASRQGRALVCSCIRASDFRVISFPDPECLQHAYLPGLLTLHGFRSLP